MIAASMPSRLLAADPYEINAILPLTGGGAFLGKKEAQALGVAEMFINKDGGINGRPVKFVIGDDQTNPQVSVQLLNGLVEKKVPAFIGSALAAMCRAQEAIIERTGPLQYCLSTAVDPPEGYSFAVAMASRGVAAAFVNYLRSRTWNRIALITTTDASGQDFEREFLAALRESAGVGMGIVANEHFNPTDLTAAAQVARIKAALPNVVMTFAPGTPFGTLLQNIHDSELNLPIMSSGANMTLAQMTQYERFLPKELYFNAVRGVNAPEPGNGPVQRAQKRFFEAYKSAGIVPEFGDTIAWDPAFLIVEALRHAGPNPTAESVRAYISKQHNWAGTYGVYDFASIKQRGLDERSVILYRWEARIKNFAPVNAPGAL
jgi:branched-chain amino acid transport system substrate-binding protein